VNVTQQYYRQRPPMGGGMASGFVGPITPVLKVFVIACIAVFFIQTFWPGMIVVMGLVPPLFWRGMFWQVVTFNFLHSGFFHIFFNLLVLAMFGGELEKAYGSRRFAIFMAVSGIGAGLSMAVVTPSLNVPVVGASGIVYAVLLAYGIMFPNRMVLFFFVLPMKIKHLVLLLGGVEFFYTVTGTQTGVAHLAHLGGMLFGFLYLRWDKIYMRLRQQHYSKKREKLKSRFYSVKSDDDDEPRVYN